jgi:hypothetical protein
MSTLGPGTTDPFSGARIESFAVLLGRVVAAGDAGPPEPESAPHAAAASVSANAATAIADLHLLRFVVIRPLHRRPG